MHYPEIRDRTLLDLASVSLEWRMETVTRVIASLINIAGKTP